MSPFLSTASQVFAQALSPEQTDLYNQGIDYFDSSTSDSTCDVSPQGTVTTTQEQVQVIQTIIGIAKTDNLGQPGALIGIMVADDESGFAIYANSSVPISLSVTHTAVGSNGDSLGVFQQQPQDNWSTVASGLPALSNLQAVTQLMDPAYNAEAFFGSPPGANIQAPDPSALEKGLQNIVGWQDLTPWAAGQAVQHSGTSDGSNYEHFLPDAQALLNKYWASSPEVPLPVSVTGGQSTNPSSSYCGSTSPPGTYQDPLRSVQQLRAERIDQGVDYAGQGPVYALGNGVIKNLTNSGWNFGGYDAFISEELSDGPAAGDYVYVAEACVPDPSLQIGETVTANTVICNMINPASTGIETGWASPPGNGTALAVGTFDGKNSTALGVNYSQLLFKLNAPAGIQEGTTTGSLPANWPQW